jgi:uncharacterized membrane protein
MTETHKSIDNGRIWELDALRGLCILCVIIVHTLFDLVYFWHLPITFPPVYQFIQDNGGVIFILLSGICVTLGSRSLRRGLIVLGFGMVITIVTWGMTKVGMAGPDLVVRFGILHLLGTCMILYPIFKAWPIPLVSGIGVIVIIAGYLFLQNQVQSRWLFLLGLRYPGFTSGDYFPLFPYLGWFLLGTVLGKIFYSDRTTKFPHVRHELPVIRFFKACGRQSLWIYLLHQPIVYGILTILTL